MYLLQGGVPILNETLTVYSDSKTDFAPLPLDRVEYIILGLDRIQGQMDRRHICLILGNVSNILIELS